MFKKRTQVVGLFIFLICLVSSSLLAQEEASRVEINGDTVEFSMKENKMIAEGNVSVVRPDMTLFCDRLEFSRDTKIAEAKGNVVMIREDGRMEAEEMIFNFETKKGDFFDAKFYSKPFFGRGKIVSRVGENHMRMKQGYLTTCDLDKPHFRFFSKVTDIYPGDKSVSRNLRLIVGEVPIIFIPRLTQDLSGKKPLITYTPGYDKQWGGFLLSSIFYELNDNLKGTLHLDYRTRRDIAPGLDLIYNTDNYGNGIIRTYYMNERRTSSKQLIWKPRTRPTIERERFKVEWRHQWRIDKRTDAILQYYKLSDGEFLKEFFEREYEKDTSVSTYFLITRASSAGTLSFRTDARVNRFESGLERLPEISYNSPSKEIFNTGFYIKDLTTYSNLSSKSASPSEIRRETMRVDTDNELSYPMKVSFIEMNLFVGGRQTYYSKVKDPSKYDSIRGVFRTGADLSTKFYRIFDLYTGFLNLDIHRLRHIITPTIAYLSSEDPTMPNIQLDQFDSIDSATRKHSLNFAIENKLQTKRNKSSVDLARLVVSTDFSLKENPGKGGFNTITTDLDLKPHDALTFYMDSTFDTKTRSLQTVNFDLYINDASDDWYIQFGKRWSGREDDQITADFGYAPNQKWRFRTYQRFDVDKGILKEQEYNVRRDMHAWILDINFNQTRGQGSAIWLVFTMKTFPEMGFDFGTNFNRRKAGSQSR